MSIFFLALSQVYVVLCEPATIESNSESRMISLFYESHSTFLAGSQETTSCRIRTGNGATVNRILNELIENLVAIA